jgi:medium-chain acyl-[acyl-carrier-protein] hydrolase
MDRQPGLVFEQRRTVRFQDVDGHQRLTVRGAMRWFEEIALAQSETLGLGLDFYRERRISWLLRRWDLRLCEAPPRFTEEVTVRTRPTRWKSFTAHRRFAVLDAEGETLVEGRSQWVLVDTERRRPARVPPDISAAYSMEESEKTLPWDAVPAAPERVDREIVVPVRRSDIDVNGHVNNACYVAWAEDSLPEELLRECRPSRVLVHYRGETRFPADVRVETQIEEPDGGPLSRHRLSEGDRAACQLEIAWHRTP